MTHIRIPWFRIKFGWRCTICRGEIRWRDMLRNGKKCSGEPYAGWCVRK